LTEIKYLPLLVSRHQRRWTLQTSLQ